MKDQEFTDLADLLHSLINAAIESIIKAGSIPVDANKFLGSKAVSVFNEADAFIFPNIRPCFPLDYPCTDAERKKSKATRRENTKVSAEWNEKIKTSAVAIALLSFRPAGVRYAGMYYQSSLSSGRSDSTYRSVARATNS